VKATQLSADATLATIETSLAQAQNRAADPATGLMIGAKPAAGTESTQERIKREIAVLMTVAPKAMAAAPAAAPAPASMSELMTLKQTMEAPVTTTHYTVSPTTDTEMVEGKRGRYYLIDLKNAANGAGYRFDGGRYVMTQNLPQFKQSIDTLVQDILSKIDGKASFDLMVRGRADAQPMKGKLPPARAVKVISYLPSSGTNTYKSNVAQEKILGAIKNDNLPNLRASYLSDLVAQTYPAKRPVILQGFVSPQLNADERNAQLILYVGW
jgi:hypothetical protein